MLHRSRSRFSPPVTDERQQVMRELMGWPGFTAGGAPRCSRPGCGARSRDKCGATLAGHPSHRPWLGMRSNVTMLYGHIETYEERVDHMLRVRPCRTRRAASSLHPARVPPRQQPDAQAARPPASRRCACTRGAADARQCGARKAFWIATGIDVAQTSLWFGVDDLDGPCREKIYHMAGARTPK